MKHLLKFTAAICIAIVLFSSCKKDNNKAANKSEVANKSESVKYPDFSSRANLIDTISPKFVDSLRTGTNELFKGINPMPNGINRQVIADNFDPTARMEITIWADYVDGQHNHAEVSVDASYVMIGGGARTSNFSNTNAGDLGLLTAAYPKDDGTFSTFVADSKDHLVAYNHRLWVYVVGMRLFDAGAGVIDPATVIIPNMNITKTTSSSAAHPTTTACAPSGYTLLSGGAKVNWSGAGNLLTGSIPSSLTCWTSASKDHGISSPATIESYALSIIANGITAFGTIEASSYAYTTLTYNGQIGSVNLSSLNVLGTGNWLISGIGGNTTYSLYGGRLLIEMYPLTGTDAKISDKDHSYADHGTLTGQIGLIRRL